MDHNGVGLKWDGHRWYKPMYKRGHEIEWDGGKWVYADDKSPVEGNERPCARCGGYPTPEGYDACLGHLQNADGACCGHGVRDGYWYQELGD